MCLFFVVVACNKTVEPEQLGAFLKPGGGVMEPTMLPPPELKMGGIQGEAGSGCLRRLGGIYIFCSCWWFMRHGVVNMIVEWLLFLCLL